MAPKQFSSGETLKHDTVCHRSLGIPAMSKFVVTIFTRADSVEGITRRPTSPPPLIYVVMTAEWLHGMDQ